MRCFGCRGDPLLCMAELIERPLWIGAEILYRTADQAGCRGKTDGLRHPVRCVGETLLQIGGNRQIGRFHDRAGMGERLLAGDHAVTPAEHPGRGAAGGRQGVKAEPRKDPRRTRIPSIGNDKKPRFPVQRLETARFLTLAGCHVTPPGRIDATGPILLLNPTSCAGGEPVLSAVSVGEAQYALVIGDERAAEFDRGRDQEPIGRVAVRKVVKLVAPGCGAVTERRRLGAGQFAPHILN